MARSHSRQCLLLELLFSSPSTLAEQGCAETTASGDTSPRPTLLQRLQSLPPVLPVQTLEKVARRATKRIGRVMANLLNKLMGMLTEAISLPLEDALEAAMLCTHAYALVARRD